MKLTVDLVTEVFPGPDGPARLARHLRQSKDAGADLAVLPELPMDRWIPATREVRSDDAEAPLGPRHQAMAAAAREAGMALMGGAIVTDPDSGRRANRALLFDAEGVLLARYDKVHLPSEEGYWERDHYDPGGEVPGIAAVGEFPIGLQICSDLNRPTLVHALAANGAGAILAPRCTPSSSYERWRVVIRANAIIGSCYLLSVNRPCPEAGVPIGGPSLAVGPDGEILAESTDPSCLVTLDLAVVEEARQEYPGYIGWSGDLYARAWSG